MMLSRRKRMYYFAGLFFLGVFIFLFVSCETTGTDESTGASGSIVVTLSTPDIPKGTAGYMEGTGTLVIENGAPVSYEFVGKRQVDYSLFASLAAAPLTNEAMREKITVTSTTSGSGLFDQFAGATLEMQYYDLASIDDEVPPFDSADSMYDSWTTKLFWTNGLLTGQEDYDNGAVSGTRKWEYYQDGTVKSERTSENATGPTILADAEYVPQNDATFTTMPAEQWHYWTGGSESIPDGYDYENDPSNYYSGGTGDSKFTYTQDANGRVSQVLVEDGDHTVQSWTNNMRVSITYDDNGSMSSVVFEAWDAELTKWFNVGKVDFTQPADLPHITIEDFFFGPWRQGILPFME